MPSPFEPTPGGVGIGTPTAPGSPERAELSARWMQYLAAPQTQAALLQAGINMMQPRSRFDTDASVLGRALGGGAAAAGRVSQQQEAERARAVREGLAERAAETDERRAAVAERGAATAERGAATAERRADIAAGVAGTGRREAESRIEARTAASERDRRRLDLESEELELRREANAAERRRLGIAERGAALAERRVGIAEGAADVSRREAESRIAERAAASAREGRRLELEAEALEIKRETNRAERQRRTNDMYVKLVGEQVRYGFVDPAEAQTNARKMLADMGLEVPGGGGGTAAPAPSTSPTPPGMAPPTSVAPMLSEDQKRAWRGIAADPVLDRAAREDFGDAVVDGIYRSLGLKRPGSE